MSSISYHDDQPRSNEPLEPARPIAIVGSTGTGKSDLSLALAELSDREVEIVNTDSMQMYRGMDIGTAKLPAATRALHKHHLFNVMDVTEQASVAVFRDAARELIEGIRRRGNQPVIVGGSMMYLQALVDDWDFPPTDPAVRKKWMDLQAEVGVEAMHDRLREIDPAAADVIERKDPRRIVRALEVIELTGKPYAASQPPKNMPTRWNTAIFGLWADAEWLNPRLEARVDLMFEQGLVDEVAALRDQGLVRDSTAGKAIGYSQVLDALAGEISLKQAREDVVIGTRRYARRQRSWFKRDPRIKWLDATEQDPEGQARKILETLNNEVAG